MSAQAALIAIGTAAPESTLDAETSLALAQRLSPDQDQQRFRDLYARSGVSTRASVLTDGADGQRLFGDAAQRGPTTAARLLHFHETAAALASKASTAALQSAEVPAGQITHLITVSCTGAHSPGLDHDLIERLGLSTRISRTHIGFMGCHGAINGIAAAAAFVRADPDATALVACAEVCSLHYQTGGAWDQQVANAIFADGAASAVIGRRTGAPAISAFASQVFPKTRGLMSWAIGDHGFEMRLSPRVPGVLRRQLRAWLEPWLHTRALAPADVAGWAVHPGGRDILQAVQSALDLPDPALAASRATLDQHGNMSSGTVLWVLNTLRRAETPGPILALAFGPGLTGEAMLLDAPER